MKGAWRQSGVAAAVADHIGGGGLAGYGGLGFGARRARLCLYGFALAFAAFAAFLAFAPSLPAPPPSSPAAAWFDGFLASTSPYRTQVSIFLSSIFPANSSSPALPNGVAVRRSGKGGVGFAATGGQIGTNGSSAVQINERSESGGGGGGSAGSEAGGVPSGNSAPGNTTPAVQIKTPPNDHVGGGAAANNYTEIAGAEAKAWVGVATGGSAKNATLVKGGVRTHDSEVNASSATAGDVSTVQATARNTAGSTHQLGSGILVSSNRTAVLFINQTGSAVPAVAHDSGAASQRRGAPGNKHSPAANNQNQSGSRVASGGSNSTMNTQREATPPLQGSANLVKNHTVHAVTANASNRSAVAAAGNGQPAKEMANAAGEKKVHWIEAMAGCDMFYGNWVRDDSYPLYPEGSCPHVDESFNCYLNGRPDRAYQRLRWQPSGCSIPRLNPTDMLEKLRGKRLVFVGDSLNRNMWESLVCILRNSIKDKTKVFEVSGNQRFRAAGSYSFLFQDYNCSLEFFHSPFLVQEWEMPVRHGKTKETLRLDIINHSSSRYKNADIIIFNTGHWWTHEKTSLGKDYYQEGNRVYSELNVHDAFRRALNTWAKWVDSTVNPNKTTVLFRGYSASHFSGGQWNSGGSCDKETEPITNDQYLIPYPQKMNILEEVLHGMKTPVVYLNITRMTDYRKEAHPSVFRKQKLTQEERKSPEIYQDCSHWCLPGVPDSWNELLYAQILVRQHQMLHQ